jgi:hypothetical protein
LPFAFLLSLSSLRLCGEPVLGSNNKQLALCDGKLGQYVDEKAGDRRLAGAEHSFPLQRAMLALVVPTTDGILRADG